MIASQFEVRFQVVLAEEGGTFAAEASSHSQRRVLGNRVVFTAEREAR